MDYRLEKEKNSKENVSRLLAQFMLLIHSVSNGHSQARQSFPYSYGHYNLARAIPVDFFCLIIINKRPFKDVDIELKI